MMRINAEWDHLPITLVAGEYRATNTLWSENGGPVEVVRDETGQLQGTDEPGTLPGSATKVIKSNSHIE